MKNPVPSIIYIIQPPICPILSPSLPESTRGCQAMVKPIALIISYLWATKFDSPSLSQQKKKK